MTMHQWSNSFASVFSHWGRVPPTSRFLPTYSFCKNAPPSSSLRLLRRHGSAAVRLWALIDAADAAVDAEAPGGALNALVRSAPPALARSGPRDGADLCLYRPLLASHDSSYIDLSFPCIDLSFPCL